MQKRWRRGARLSRCGRECRVVTRSRSWGTTQTEVKAQFDEGLAGLAEGRGVSPIVVSAKFGAGKSHLLNYLQALAAQQGFVTSFVVVSPEMPLGNAPIVLRTLAEAAQAPGSADTALRALAANLNTSSTAFNDLKAWTREAGLDDRFRALLHIYQEFRADEELRAQVLEDFEGKFLPKAVVKQKLKELGALVSYDLSGPRNALVAHDRIRLLARLYRAGGGKGLVVLFDELERIAKFSIKQRLSAYQELGWWSDIAQQEGSAILPVFTMTQGFVNESITGGTRDEQRFLANVNSSGTADERDLRALRGITLLKKPYYLESPTPEQEEQVKYRVKNLYDQAYNTSVPFLPRVRGDVRTTIRSEIRRWITLWDLHRYYPDYTADIESGDVQFDTSEISDQTLAEAEASEETNE